MLFIEKLELLMKQQGLNNHSLSIASGIPYTTIDGWYKKGYDGVKVSTIKKLSHFFGVPLDYFIDGSEDIEKAPTEPKPDGGAEPELIDEVDRKTELIHRLLIEFGCVRNGKDFPEKKARAIAAVLDAMAIDG